MVWRPQSLFRSREDHVEFRAATRPLLLERLRIGAVLALVLIPSFIPIDYLRMPEHFGWAVVVRTAGCAALAALFPFLYMQRAERCAEWLTAAALSIIGVTILAVARYATGPADPVYLVQSMAIIFLVTGAALLLPLDGESTLVVASIPVALQMLLTRHFPLVENLPILTSSVTALVVATVGAESAFVARLGEYASRRSKERLVEVLRKSEQKYRSLFEESRDGLLLTSIEGRIVDANPAVVALLGYGTKENLLALQTADLYYESPESARSRLLQLLLDGDVGLRDVELDLRRKDGRKVSAVLSSTPVRDEQGEIRGFRTIIRDVTERRILEARLRQTQKLEAVGMLAAGVAHEINNPLTYVIGHLDTLGDDVRRLVRERADSPLASSIEARLQEACEGASRVRSIVRDLKSFARLGEEERSAVDVVAALRKALKLASAEIRCRARLTEAICPVPAVAGNDGRLAQVFVNLLINAAQAIDEGAADRNEIRVATRATDSAVAVEIADTGRGIAPEHLDQLFDPFFTTKSAAEGSGLGLAICYNIVSAYGGRIEVESTPGRGTRFVVELPLADVARAPAPAETPPPAPIRRARVLVIDDDPFVLSTIRIILGRDHEVVGLDDAAEALRLVGKDDAFDVVLCDLMLERSSGMEVYAELLRTAPELARRVVFMTGGAYTPQARAFVARVPNACIDKPFGAAELTKAVERVFAAHATGAAPLPAACDSDFAASRAVRPRTTFLH